MTRFRSRFHSMPCFRGFTPVSMLTCDGSVMEFGVVRAQNVNVLCGRSALMFGVLLRSSHMASNARDVPSLGR